ncbi:MAG: hypothetical protein LBP23_09680, partial [Treponema sp.]|nr:hypothetical protein [Treponema sp.]
MKIRSVFSLFLTFCLLVFSGCFQSVDIGETFVEKATAHLRVTNDSADESYILDGLELRNAEGAAVWEGLNLSKGQSWEVHTETAGTFTLWYRVKDTWFSANEVKAYNGGPVEIALNKSHEFLFEGEKFDVTQQDSDEDGYPDAWEEENGFDPNDSGDGGIVYVKANGQDEAPGNGTRDHPYKTLAKAVAKAGRGLSPAIRTVVVMGPAPLSWGTGGNEPNNLEFPGREDSVFYLGKTRDRVTIRGEGPDNPGILTAETVTNKRVLYLDSGADIAFQDIRITKGRHIGGGVYASG